MTPSTSSSPSRTILARLRALLDPDAGVLAIGHVHNSECDNLSAGAAISAEAMAALFPEGLLYDDAELTRALAEDRAPTARAGARPAPGRSLRRRRRPRPAAGPGR